jgi:hypothetical protein
MRDASMAVDWLLVVPPIGLYLSPLGRAEPSAVDCLRFSSLSLLRPHCRCPCSAGLRHGAGIGRVGWWVGGSVGGHGMDMDCRTS